MQNDQNLFSNTQLSYYATKDLFLLTGVFVSEWSKSINFEMLYLNISNYFS